MFEAIYSLPYCMFEVPNVRVLKPTWIAMSQPMTVFSIVLVSYFLVTGGFIYNVIVEPPSVGSTTDEHGHSRPVAFMAYRLNGRYIMEGLASSFMFGLGAIGFIILDKTHDPATPKFIRMLFIFIGYACVIISSAAGYAFMKIKLPGYLKDENSCGAHCRQYHSSL